MRNHGVSVAPEPVACPGVAGNCDLLRRLAESHHERCAAVGIAGTDGMLNATAVGLVIDVWRNGPVEDMHASKRGPSDAAMFAESTELHGEAVKALTAANRAFGLIDFEKHLLDRTRPWAGSGGRTLAELGRGHLGAYRRHVKERTNLLMSIDAHTCVDDALELFLVPTAIMYGRDHRGMPEWPTIIERIGILLHNPGHPMWRESSRGAEALSTVPISTSIDEIVAALGTRPASLPTDVLQWLSDHVLYCAGPPYSPQWRTIQATDPSDPSRA